MDVYGDIFFSILDVYFCIAYYNITVNLPIIQNSTEKKLQIVQVIKIKSMATKFCIEEVGVIKFLNLAQYQSPSSTTLLQHKQRLSETDNLM